jgi:undecaprenyl-diphosphatase
MRQLSRKFGRSRRRRGADLTLPLVGVGVGAAVAFAVLARRVAGHETAHADGELRKQVPKRRGPRLKRAAELLGPLGKPELHAPVAAVLAAYTRPKTKAGAAAIAASSAVSTAASHAFERLLPHRRPPEGRHEPSEPSFPSGHSLETAAVALTTAWVLAREGRANPWIAAPAAIVVPFLSGAGRVYLDRHWGTDVVGGWLAGTAVAAGCAAMYERNRG